MFLVRRNWHRSALGFVSLQAQPENGYIYISGNYTVQMPPLPEGTNFYRQCFQFQNGQAILHALPRLQSKV